MPMRADATEELCRAGRCGALSRADRALKLDLHLWNRVLAAFVTNHAGEGSVPRVTADVSQAGASPAEAEGAVPSSL